jgi:hypothetical protein
MPVPAYAIDDQTAITVIDGVVDVISEVALRAGHVFARHHG